MNATSAKAQGGAIGGGFGATIGVALANAIFAAWPTLLGSTWEGIVTALIALTLAAASAAFGAWLPRNDVTADQIKVAVAIQPELPGELHDAGLVVKPVPVPGGDGRAHSSTDTPKPRAVSKKGSAK